MKVLIKLFLIILLFANYAIIYANIQGGQTSSCKLSKFKTFQLQYCLYPGRGPLLVFESGEGNGMNSWPSAFISKLNRNNAILIYNRIGYGLSRYFQHKPNKIVTAKTVAKHLSMLLDKLSIPKKKILVAHSIGGIYAQYFVRAYPKVFSALVLLDADSSFEPLKNSPFQSKSPATTGSIAYYESMGFNSSMAQVNAAPKFPNIPLLVISATNHHSPQNVEQLWQKLQKKMVSQSKQGYQVIANGSGHYVFIDKPSLVINAINNLTKKVTSTVSRVKPEH